MWARAVPYEEFGRLRREAPVAWSPDDGSGFWSFYKVTSPTIYAPWIALAVLVIGFELSDLTKSTA